MVQDPKQALLDMIDSGPLPSERQSLMDMIDLGGPPKPHSRRTGTTALGVAQSVSDSFFDPIRKGATAGMGRAIEFAGTAGQTALNAVIPSDRTRAAKARSVEAAGQTGRDLQAEAAAIPEPTGYGGKLLEGLGGAVPLLAAGAANPILGVGALVATAGSGVEDTYTRTLEQTGDEAKAVQAAVLNIPLEGLMLAPVVRVLGRLGKTAGGSLWRNAIDGALTGALGPGSARVLGEVAGEQITKEEKADLAAALKRGGEAALSEAAVSAPLFGFLHAAAGLRMPKAKALGQPKAEAIKAAEDAGFTVTESPDGKITATLESKAEARSAVEPGGSPPAATSPPAEARPVEHPEGMRRSQLSMEMDEGRAARTLGLPIEANPYRKLGGAPNAPQRWDEMMRNWDSGWASAKSEAPTTQSGQTKTASTEPPGSETARPRAGSSAEQPASQAETPESVARREATTAALEAERAALGEAPDLVEIRDRRPRPLNKAYGPNPTPEQAASHKKAMSAWNSEYRKASAAHKEYVEASNALFRREQEAGERGAGEGVRPPRKPQAEPVEAPPPEPSVAPSGEPAKAQEAQGVTATKNAETDRQRAARNLPPAMEAAKRDFEGVWDSAMKQIDEDPGAPERLVQDLAEKPRAATDAENALLLHRQIELQTEHSKVADQLLRASEAGDTARLGELQKRAGRVSDQLLQLYEVGRSAGTETGRGLNARKMLAAEDFSLATMETALRVEQKGARLSPEQTATIKELHEKIAATQKAFDEYRARQEKAPRAPKPDSKARVLDFMDAQARAARERIRQRGTRAMAGLDPADLADRVIVGADFLAKDIAKFAEWSTAMVGEFGEAIKPHLDDIYSQAKAYLDAAPKKAGALQAFKTRTKGAIEKTETKLEAGDFEPAPKRQPLALDKEGVTLKANLEEVKRRYQRELLRARYKNRTTGEKWKDWGKEALNLPKALMTAYDFSAVLRQGAFFSFAHPIKAAKSLPDMFAATLSERKALEIDVALRARPNAQLGETAKLELTRHGDDIGKHEEAIRSAWSDKIPGIKASNRAFITFLNMQRATAFDALVDAVPGGATPEQARAIASLVNIGTGRGEPGKFAATVSAASNVLWSPRLLLSRFQLLAGQPLYKGDMVTRRLVAQEYARSLAGLGAVYALARLAGADIETDPRSSDFGKLRFGSTRVDPLAGLSQVSVLLSRLGLGETKTGKGEIVPIRGERKYGQASGYEVMARFLRSKLSPTLGTSIDIVSGENMIGEPTTPQSVAKNALVPLSFQDILKAMEDQGVERGAALAILSTLGMGLQVHEKKVK